MHYPAIRDHDVAFLPSCLQGYYHECSQGKSNLDRTNSRVVGPIPIPCNYSGSAYSFTTETCTYADSDGWHNWAQSYVQVVMLRRKFTFVPYLWQCKRLEKNSSTTYTPLTLCIILPPTFRTSWASTSQAISIACCCSQGCTRPGLAASGWDRAHWGPTW